jgi:hypothetical protein
VKANDLLREADVRIVTDPGIGILRNTRSSAKRLGLFAAAIETVAGVGMFLIGVATLPGALGVSAATAIFGPLPYGGPLIEELYLVAIVVGVQTLSAIALDQQRVAWLRIAGAVGSFLLAAICLFWIVFVVGQWASVALGGSPAGDRADLISETYWVPVTLAIGALNGLAMWRAFSSRLTPSR